MAQNDDLNLALSDLAVFEKTGFQFYLLSEPLVGEGSSTTGTATDAPLISVSASQLNRDFQWRTFMHAKTRAEMQIRCRLLFKDLGREGQKVLHIQDVYAPAFQLLLSSPVHMVEALYSAISDAREAADLSRSLVSILDVHQLLVPVLHKMLKTQFQDHREDVSDNALLRGNSPGIKLLSEYTKEIGQGYLQMLFSKMVSSLSDHTSLELSEVLGLSAKQRQKNIAKLQELTTSVIASLREHIDQVPPEIREFCCWLRKSVERLPELSQAADQYDWKTATGGYFFLRFLCPAFVNPVQYGLLSDGESTPEIQRSLVLLTKILQNCSNGTEFKEPYMVDLNPFVRASQPSVAALIDALSTSPGLPPPADIMGTLPMRGRSFVWSVTRLTTLLHYHIGSISTYLEERGQDASKIDVLVDAFEECGQELSEVSDEEPRRGNSTGRPHPGRTRSLLSFSSGIFKRRSLTLAPLRTSSGPTLEVLEPTPTPGPTPIARKTSLGQGGLRRLLPVSPAQDNIVANPPQKTRRQELAGVPHFLSVHMAQVLSRIWERNLGAVDRNNYELFAKDPGWEEFTDLVGLLGSLSLAELSQPDLLVFFLNVYNIMIVHLHVLCGPPINKERSAAFLTYSYYIAGQRWSHNDILSGVLRGNPKAAIRRVLPQYVLQSFDPRVVLAAVPLDTEIARIPILDCTTADFNLDRALHQIATDFCSTHVAVEVNQMHRLSVRLPNVFRLYAPDFGKSKENCCRFATAFLPLHMRVTLRDALETKRIGSIEFWPETIPLRYGVKFVMYPWTDQDDDQEEADKLAEQVLVRVRSAESRSRLGDANSLDLKNKLEKTAVEAVTAVVETCAGLHQTLADAMTVEQLQTVANKLKNLAGDPGLARHLANRTAPPFRRAPELVAELPGTYSQDLRQIHLQITKTLNEIVFKAQTLAAIVPELPFLAASSASTYLKRSLLAELVKLNPNPDEPMPLALSNSNMVIVVMPGISRCLKALADLLPAIHTRLAAREILFCCQLALFIERLLAGPPSVFLPEPYNGRLMSPATRVRLVRKTVKLLFRCLEQLSDPPPSFSPAHMQSLARIVSKEFTVERITKLARPLERKQLRTRSGANSGISREASSPMVRVRTLKRPSSY